MSTSVVENMPDTVPDTIMCPHCNGRGKFSRMEVLESLGMNDDESTDQVWSAQELVELLVEKRRREQQIKDGLGDRHESGCSTRGSDMVHIQVHPQVRSTDFVHRKNDDCTIDSICKSCSLVVARVLEERDLEQMELRHVCQPIERRKHVRTVHRTHLYHVRL
jgi:hypothetical protein